MLAAVRTFAKSFVARILLGILIVSFAIFGIGDVFRQAGSDVVVKAGSREVTTADFKREFDGYKQQTEQRVGQPIPVEMAVEKGLDRQVLEGLAGRESFAELMHRMGVRISDEQLVAQIQKIPAFFDKMTGKFDQKLYAGALAERQLTPTLFENYMRDDMAQQQMMAAMASGLRTPRAYAVLGAAYVMESRDATFFMVDPRMVPPPAQPTDAQLQAFMKENAAQLTRPEFRQLTIVRFSSKALEPSMRVDPAEVQKRYDFAKDSMSTPETRTVVQIPAKDAATAARVAQALNSGTDIAPAAKMAGVEPVLYADKPKSAIVDPKVAEVAFSLPAGAVSQPIQGDLGFAVVKVLKITRGKTVSFAEAKPQIEAQIRADEAGQKVYDQSQVYQDAHTAGSSLTEAAAKAGAPVQTTSPVTAEGQLPDGKPSNIPAEILKSAFDLPSGGESDIEEAGKGEYYAVRVDKIIPPALPPLAEVKPQLERVYMLRELTKAMQAKADALSARVQKGESIAAVAASVGAHATTVAGVSRFKAQQFASLGRDFLMKMFAAKPGEVFTAQAAQFGIAVAKLDGVHSARPDDIAPLVEQQRQQLTQDLFEQVGNSAEAYARDKVKAKTNLDKARLAIGVDPKEIEAKQTNTPTAGNKAP
jgi:peptidyl-prolyl cis-trans isomerase D